MIRTGTSGVHEVTWEIQKEQKLIIVRELKKKTTKKPQTNMRTQDKNTKCNVPSDVQKLTSQTT